MILSPFSLSRLEQAKLGIFHGAFYMAFKVQYVKADKANFGVDIQ